MKSLIINRIFQGLFTILLVSVLIFIGTEILPGDLALAILGQDATPETLHALRVSLNLYDPAPLRYLDWLRDILTGDLGLSLTTRAPIAPEVLTRLYNTFVLAGISACVVVPLSLIVGIMVAIWRNGLFDRGVNLLALGAISLPEFLVAYVLIIVLSVEMNIFPSLANMPPGISWAGRLHAMALPIITLTLAVFAYIMRMTRSSIVSCMSMPYVEMAELKGVPRWRIVLFHVLPNSLAPILQVIAVNLSFMVAGVVLVEFIYVYPGLGQYLIDGIGKRDLPVVQICGLIFSATYVVINMIADIMAIFINPRLRYPR